MFSALLIALAVCGLALLASALISRASNLSPAANIILVVFVVLVFTTLAIAALAFLSRRAFPD